MISVVIPTHESERLLVPTLAALVPGAVAGMVREVIVADAGSHDETAKVADLAGCSFMLTPGPLGARLAAAAASARADWLLFLHPGSVPEANWTAEAERFINESERAGIAREQAAVLRSRPGPSGLREVLALVAAALVGPVPSQGLLIAKPLYRSLGGHDATSGEPEAALLRKLGRRRIARLRCVMAQTV